MYIFFFPSLKKKTKNTSLSFVPHTGEFLEYIFYLTGLSGSWQETEEACSEEGLKIQDAGALQRGGQY